MRKPIKPRQRGGSDDPMDPLLREPLCKHPLPPGFPELPQPRDEMALSHVARQFRAIPEDKIAAWCRVSVRTARAWKDGRSTPSPAHLYLFTLFRDGRVMDAGWKGWKFHDGELYDRSGKSFSRGRLEAYQLIVQLATEKARAEVELIWKWLDRATG